MYPYIDMHCDTLLYDIRHKNTDGIYDMPGAMLDVRRMKEGGALAQFFAVFFPPRLDMLPEEKREEAKKRPQLPDDETLFAMARQRLIDAFENHGDILAPAGCYEDIIANREQGKMSGVLTIEDGRAVLGSMDRLKQFHEEGVRAIALTWNFENCFGYPNSSDPQKMALGLKPFGKEAVEYMNELGIIVDVSHLSDGGFYDIAEIAKKPFVATHSDCRALAGHQRNLTDDMIRILSEKGGIAGLNFAPEFLDDTPSNKESRISDMVRHVKHFYEVGGEDCVGIGTDFDGIDGKLEVAQPTDMYKLFDALEKAGITPRQIDKMASGNALRVIREAAKGSIR